MDIRHDVTPVLCVTTERLAEVVKHYSHVDSFAFDVETDGPHRGDPQRNRVTWITLATYGRADVIPMGHPNGPNLIDVRYPLLKAGAARQAKGLPPKPSDYSTDIRKAEFIFDEAPDQLSRGEVFAALKPVFMNPDIVKIGHNLGFDLKSVAKYLGGQVPVPPYADTLIAEWVLDTNNMGALSLDQCLLRTLGMKMEKGVGKEIERYSFTDVAQYAHLDAKGTWLLWQELVRTLNDLVASGYIFDLEMRVLSVVVAMEMAGVRIDLDALAALKSSLESDIDTARAKVYAAAGRTFNINSTPQKQQVLYGPKSEGGRGLHPQAMTTGGEKNRKAGKAPVLSDWSVSDAALKPHEGDALVDALMEYADLNKLLSTYAVPYAGGEVTRTTGDKERIETRESMLVAGRLHGRFVQHGTASGRFSSREPNLQNVPSRTAHGKMIRRLFVPDPGHKFLVADYSQVEPRIIASLSGDKVMIETYNDGGDVYLAVAERLDRPRAVGKEMVLSLAYGIGASTISERIGVSSKEAKELMEFFSSQFPAIGRHKRVVIQQAQRSRPKKSTTLFGRHRIIPELASRDEGERARGERIAYNHVIQGTAADINKMALVRAHDMLPPGCRILLTVHDEIVVDCPEGLVDEASEALREAMEHATDRLVVPLVADLHVVSDWSAAK